MKKIFIFSIITFLILLANISYAQTVYRSIATGNYNANTTWEISIDGGVTYNPTTAAQVPTSNTSIIIQSPNVVTIPAGVTATCLNATINTGGTLTDAGVARALRAGTTSAGTSGTIATITNNGTLGGPTDQIVLELPLTCAQLTVTGSGVYNIGRIRALTGNTNNPSSATAGHANSAQLIIDANVNCKTANYDFSGPNSSVTTTDVFIFTINSGKTLTVSDPNGRWENSLMTSNGVVNGGSYTYNINGTLDLSANTTGTSAFIPYANTASAINVNITGLVKLGQNFKADTVNTSLGGINLSITNGGVLDATATTNFRVGKKPDGSGTLGAVKDLVFGVDATSTIKQTVGASQAKFPVGLNTNPTPNTVYISNTGTSDVFTVGLKGTIDNAPPDANKVVNRQWTINEAVAGGTDATVALSWTTADQAAGFNPTQTVSILRWTGTAYEPHTATVTGTGTANDPYIATASGFTAFSPFIVANFVVLPITFQTSKAYQKNSGIQVEWSISNDNTADKYIVERSASGNSFSTVGTVSALNIADLNNYSWFDANPLSGNNFYRIKGVDKNGGVKYTSIMKVNIGAGKPSLTISPNPLRGNILNLQLGNAVKGTYTLTLYNTGGQKIFSGEVRSEGGSSSQSVQLPSSVKPGTYTLQLNNADQKLNKTIVIE